ncbi:hypothetical protein OG279_09590 [Streptomyces sp. NBC_01201]|uniref:hypothetical protein n=1 Tax=unclassified Streptomyces TaxID=2593676 RepID=UPI002E11135D|nr:MULTISPECIES: hypothetical protein [unclassified Streptomyces]WSR09414.1 hypothetical protein OG265_26895 [Streptomyces sp. NBC_01208]WSR47858.1 hypothetical protein OG279_09590 [Streptomyces sp. NBC_01201]
MALFKRRCSVHDAPSARRIAQLEVDTGIDPDALAKHQANATSLTESLANPDLIDCGMARCRKRKG